jgi:hypothetical protein
VARLAATETAIRAAMKTGQNWTNQGAPIGAAAPGV